MYLLLYNLIIHGINFFHFLLYYYLSDYSFSSYNLIFTFFFSAFIVILITLSHRKWWKAVIVLSILSMGLIYTINHLYFSIFNTFFNPFNNLQFFNPGSKTFFWQYINTVPISIYIINFIWMAGLITVIVLYKPPYLKVEYIRFRNKVQALTKTNDRKWHYLIYSILALSTILVANYSYNSFLEENPNNDWWNKAKQQEDYTVWGNITYENLFLPIYKTFETKALEAAKPQYIEIPSKRKNPIAKIDPSTLETMEKVFYWKDVLKEKNKNKLKFNIPEKEEFTEKPNIIVLQLESVPTWAVELSPSPMPFLKKLMNENYTVQDFFANSCETINAELATLCSFYADSSGPIAESHVENDFLCLPDILKDELNYETNFYHANLLEFWQRSILGPQFGFQNLHLSPEFAVRESDYMVLEKMATDIAAKKEASFNYFVSFTSHSPHNQNYLDLYNNKNGESPDILNKHYYIPEDIKNSLDLDSETTDLFLALLSAVDQSIEHFFNLLDENNLRENSIILIHSDHRYYRFKTDDTANDFYNYNELPMVLITPESDSRTLQKIASHIDLAPTILDLLNYDKEKWPKHFIGNSLFDKNAPNIALNKCLGQIDYIDRNIIIKGNSQQNLYNYIQANTSVSDPLEYYKILEKFIESTDKALDENLLK